MLVHGTQAFLGVARVRNALWVARLLLLVCRTRRFTVVQLNLLVDVLLVLRQFEAEEFEVEVEGHDGVPGRLILLQVVLGEEGVLEGVGDFDPLVGVKRQQSLQEVQGRRAGLAE